MTLANQLLEAQSQHLRDLDPALPPWSTLPQGDLVTASVTTERVAGVMLRVTHPASSPIRFWSATHVSELVPVLGVGSRAKMDALLRVWRVRLTGWALPRTDSACVLQWPSRDAEASRALLDHGLIPLSVLAIRREVSGHGVGGDERSGRPQHALRRAHDDLVIRRARLADLPDCVNLAMLEQSYSALVGSMVPREGAAELKRTLLRTRLVNDEPVWVAERSGIVVGLMECGYTEATTGTWAASRLPPGLWGYINCASVLPGARGHGVGQALAHRAHTELATAGTVGSYLYYNPPNPLSSVFWPRQGYRPLWTVWEARPAQALR